MKPPRVLFVLLASVVIISTLSACSGAAFAASSWPGMIVDNGTAYIANGPHVYAVNLENGTEKWRYPQKPESTKSFFATPALTPDGQLIVGGYDHVLYSLNPTNGQENSWKFTDAKDRYIGSPLVTKQGIFAPNADGYLYALDFSGKPIWATPFKAGQALWAHPTTDNQCGCIYLPSMDHNIYSLNAQNGTVIWKQDLGAAIAGTPTLGKDGVLYAGTFGNEIVALDTQKSGEIKWRKPTAGWVWSGPALAGDSLYVGDIKGNLYAINAANGSEDWKIQPNGLIVSTPLVISDTVYVTTESGSIFTYDISKNPRWNQAIGGKLYAPALASGSLILITPIEAGPLLVALDANGAQKWIYTPAK
jgi:outer membrane protein assembly factor BamB